MSDSYLAFMIGLLGSVHCVGMCGPLAFAVPSLRKGKGYIFLDKVLYQGGRIVSYCLLGLIFGLIGEQIWLKGMQQMVSVVSGGIILLVAINRIFKLVSNRNGNSILLKPFNKLFGYAMKHKANHLIVGMINGLLPCGFVYLALAGALNTTDVFKGIEFMFWFGIGTAPLMLIATLSIGFTSQLFRRKINRFLPYLMVFMGVWFILRGLNLDIPYLSPAKAASVAECR